MKELLLYVCCPLKTSLSFKSCIQNFCFNLRFCLRVDSRSFWLLRVLLYPPRPLRLPGSKVSLYSSHSRPQKGLWTTKVSFQMNSNFGGQFRPHRFLSHHHSPDIRGPRPQRSVFKDSADLRSLRPQGSLFKTGLDLN